MAISSILFTALSGLRDSAQRTNAAASNIVNQNTPGYQPVTARSTSQVTPGPSQAGSGVETQILAQDGTVDVGREFSRLIVAEAAYKANAKVLRDADDLAKTLIDVSG